ncbi:MAG: protein kinase domain-containing protein [Gemmatimonadaceae bacterium]
MTAPFDRLSAALADRYHIERELGQGGMATVYLADDLRHSRKVAIKVLHPELSAVLGPDRFLAEIKLTASLQHPHILPLFDSGAVDGLLYYVMPYVEGETLRARLERERQLPVADAVRIATETADAIEYAHKRGVVHRDIKPENILLRDGRALVADFGIALAVQQAGGQRMTQTGMSLGTPQYMAPEQAMGEKGVDHRADIYALGAVTYEMLSGEPPFTGPTAQAIVAKVMTEEPKSLTAQRRSVPEHVGEAVRVALEKLPADRFASAQEFAAALKGETNIASTRAPARRSIDATTPWRTVALAATGIALVALAAAAWGWLRPAPAPAASVVRFQIPVGRVSLGEAAVMALSRDGAMLLYRSGFDGGEEQDLKIRRFDSSEPVTIPGTAGATMQGFSPDGSAIAFITEDLQLRVVRLGGGAPTTIFRGAEGYNGLDWGDDGYIYFVLAESQLLARVPATGGTLDAFAADDSAAGPAAFRTQRNPKLLADGRSVLYNMYRGPGVPGTVHVFDLKSRKAREIGNGGRVVGARAGELLAVTSTGELQALPFDAKRIAITGPPVTLLTGIASPNEGNAQMAFAPGTGTLAYVPANEATDELVWVDLAGAESSAAPSVRRAFTGVSISPDGARAAVSIADGGGGESIWMHDFAHQTISRFTRDGTLSFRPNWTADGRQLLFSSDRQNDALVRALWIRAADGSDSARLLARSPRHVQESSVSRDGAWLVFREGYDDGRTFRDLYYRRLTGDTTTRSYLATVADELNPELSPDGRWLAYTSNESGRDEVYVGPFPGPGGRTQVSSQGGRGPRWAHSGQRLFYRSTDNRMMAADVLPGPAFAFTNRRALFGMGSYSEDRQHQPYDLAPDDRRFLIVKSAGASNIEVVVNWEQRSRQPAAGAQ